MTPQSPINIIVAVADDWAIGRNGGMPWHISADMRFFKAKTLGNSVIMGRHTWESIGSKPLPGRENIVVSSRLAAEWNDMEELLRLELEGVVKEGYVQEHMKRAAAARAAEEPAKEYPVLSASSISIKRRDVRPATGAVAGPVTESPTRAIAVNSLEEAFAASSGAEVYIMGGGLIYRQAMDIADRLVVTHVHAKVPDADTFFPPIDPSLWAVIDNSEVFEDSRSGLKYEFRTYVRKHSDE